MLKCNYCGRLFKKSHESCPGCGAAQFEELGNVNNIVISTPPEGGYKIDLSSSLMEKVTVVMLFAFSLAGLWLMIEAIYGMIICVFNVFYFGSDWSVVFPFVLFVLLMQAGMGVGLFLLGSFFGKRIIKDKKKKKNLKFNGVLIKNMSYDIASTGSVVNGVPIYAIKVIYVDSNGTEIPLISKKEYNGHALDKDGAVDLLIDPNDYTNYYIDFEIY